MYLTGSVSPAYYYVPLLIQLYLLAPFLIPIARKKPVTLLVVTGLIQLAVMLSYYPLLLGAQNPQLIALGQLVPKWLFITRILRPFISSGLRMSRVGAGATRGCRLPNPKAARSRLSEKGAPALSSAQARASESTGSWLASVIQRASPEPWS